MGIKFDFCNNEKKVIRKIVYMEICRGRWKFKYLKIVKKMFIVIGNLCVGNLVSISLEVCLMRKLIFGDVENLILVFKYRLICLR